MFVRNRGTSRFSLLLLDEGEYYFEDFSVTYYPFARTDEQSILNKREGRLKLCSGSVLFDPKDFRYPILKFPFDSVAGCGKWNGTLLGKLPERTEVFYIRTDVTVEMRENNNNHPYRFIKKQMDHRFTLTFDALTTVLPQLQNLLRISQLPFTEKQRQLQQLIARREESISFNHTWLGSLSERTIIETTGNRITPLETNPGRVLLTDQRIYFQQLNNIGPNPVDRYALNQVSMIFKRRHSLRPIGLELFFLRSGTVVTSASGSMNYDESESLYLSFSNMRQRDQLYDALIGNKSVQQNLRMEEPEELMLKWQRHEISNYDYLMYLNIMGHRSFNDLTQYPVFPWVIADYSSPTLDLTNPASFRDLSKPIGALDPQRLAEFKERYENMPPDQPKFLYGTHYSTPGYVLFYLVRQAPEYMLRLQNGKFDAPDRMFWSIEDTWFGVLHSPADVKELIPEFYRNGEFLVNIQGLQLGARQNGEPVGDVVLPPWAAGPKDFVRICREALECDYVSERLHHWIDLIFGYKQRGTAAILADNLFYYTTYEGAVEIESIRDPVERKSLEAQINEFGQTPHQLFTTPHPARRDTGASAKINSSQSPMRPSAPNLYAPASVYSNYTPPSSMQQPPPSSQPSLEEALYSAAAFGSHAYTSASRSIPATASSSTSSLGSEAKSFEAPAANLADILPELASPSTTRRLLVDHTPPPSSSSSASSLSASSNPSMAPPPTNQGSLSPVAHSSAVISSSTEYDIAAIPNVHRLSPLLSHKLHTDVITCVRLSRTGDSLYSVGQDTSLKIFSSSSRRLVRNISMCELVLSSCQLTADENFIILGSWDNSIYLYSIPYGRVMQTLYAHHDAVSCLKLYQPSGSGAKNGHLVSGSWDGSLKMWDVSDAGISKAPRLECVDHHAEIKCVDLSLDGNIAACGASDGYVITYDLRAGAVCSTVQSHQDSVNGIAVLPCGKRAVTCSDDQLLQVIDISSGRTLNTIDTGEPLRAVVCDGNNAIVGGEGGYLRQFDLQTGVEETGGFDVAALKKRSPHRGAITCIDLDRDKKRLLTGGDDSVVALWTAEASF